MPGAYPGNGTLKCLWCQDDRYHVVMIPWYHDATASWYHDTRMLWCISSGPRRFDWYVGTMISHWSIC